MPDPDETAIREEPATREEPARWPKALGTIGIVLGVLIFIDKLDDMLLPVMFTEEKWKELLAPDVAEFVVRTLPPPAWLRRHQRSGVTLCIRWAWLALFMLGAETVRSIWWLSRHLAELQGLVPGGWEGTAVFSAVVALMVILYLVCGLSPASLALSVRFFMILGSRSSCGPRRVPSTSR